AQVENRVVLARQQRVEWHTRLGRELFEAAPLDLVSDEHLALFRRELGQRGLDLVEQHAARVLRLRAAARRRKELVQIEIVERLRLLLAEEIDDAILRHAEEPAAGLLDVA